MKVNDRGFNFEGKKDELEAYFKLKREYLSDEDERNGRPTKQKKEKIGGGPVQSETLSQEKLDKMVEEAQASAAVPEPAKPEPKKTEKVVATNSKKGRENGPEPTDISVKAWALAIKDKEIKKMKEKPANKRTAKEEKELSRAYMNARYKVTHPGTETVKKDISKEPASTVTQPSSDDDAKPRKNIFLELEGKQKLAPPDSDDAVRALNQAIGKPLKNFCLMKSYDSQNTGDDLAEEIVEDLGMSYPGVRLLKPADVLRAVKATVKQIETEQEKD